MIRSDLERIRDARSHGQHARQLASDIDGHRKAADRITRQALLYDLIVIGDTSKKLSPDVRGLAPRIPWREIIGMRNAIVHAYWQIDWDIVLNFVSDDIPAPLIALDSIEQNLGDDA